MRSKDEDYKDESVRKILYRQKLSLGSENKKKSINEENLEIGFQVEEIRI